MRAFFVTGTDTGVGKTTVATAVLAAASARGLRTGCMKPAESGCARNANGELMPADALALRAASNMGQALESVCLYRFAAPVAPGVAADQCGEEISIERIKAGFAALAAEQPDVALVEGAGGLLVPLGRGVMVADLAQSLDIPLLVVGRPGLGTINHTLLTIEVARARGIDVAGFIFSAHAADMDEAAMRVNGVEIEKASGVRSLGCLPWVAVSSTHALAQAAERGLALDLLFQSW